MMMIIRRNCHIIDEILIIFDITEIMIIWRWMTEFDSMLSLAVPVLDVRHACAGPSLNCHLGVKM